jgi:CRP-like cAMP-binding protein
MARRRYHEHLTSIPLFADLDADELDAVGRAVTELPFPADRVLLREGTRGSDMFIVVEGLLEVTRDGAHVATVGPGEFVGELAFLTGAARNATVTTRTPTRVLHVDSRALDEVLDRAPQIAVKMLPVVARRAA